MEGGERIMEQEHRTYWKPEKQIKVPKQWKPGQKQKKEIAPWRKDILSSHLPKPSTKDRAEFPRHVVEELIAEAGGKCQCCKIRPDTSTHHVQPRAAGRGGRGVKNNGMRLCIICHDQIQTNEEELQYWINEYEIKYGPRFWFDEQDWEEWNKKQAAVDQTEQRKQIQTERIEPIIELLSIASGRTLKAKELKLLDAMNESQIATFVKLMQDVIGAAIVPEDKTPFGYGYFND
jgi:hypothetical protein